MKIVLMAILLFLSVELTTAQIYIYDLPYATEVINQKDILGRKQGVWVSFYSDSQFVSTIENYSNDTLHGFYQHFNSHNGCRSEEGYYKNGKRDSICVFYWANGNPAMIVPYKDDIIHGIVKTWESDGKLRTQYKYINGEEDLSYEERYVDLNIVWDNTAQMNIIRYDTLNENWKYTKYARVTIYKNDSICQMYNLYNGHKVNESFYENMVEVKRIIYCKKKPYGIWKIFYYNEEKLVRIEIINEKCKK